MYSIISTTLDNQYRLLLCFILNNTLDSQRLISTVCIIPIKYAQSELKFQ